jgi:hypothetical protein
VFVDVHHAVAESRRDLLETLLFGFPENIQHISVIIWDGRRYVLREIEVDEHEIDNTGSDENVIVVFSDIRERSRPCLGHYETSASGKGS